MAVTKEQLDQFHRFASARLHNGGHELSIEQLVFQWRAACEREEVNEALREAADDLHAARARPAAEVTEELRQKHGIPRQ